MYERNAIVIDRYFSNVYGYDRSNNIKNNSNNYFELVEALEKYQDVSETENNIMTEFEKIASRIKETKKIQGILNKKNKKYNENRERLFEDLDEDSQILRKQFEKIQAEIDRNNEEINENAENFVKEIKEFHEKSEIRSNIGKERRIIENEYEKQLKITTDNFNNISIDKLKEIKTFIKSEDKSDVKEQISTKIAKNGAKEKIPFDENVISTAIDVSLDIEEKRAEILMSLYDKTFKLLDEIQKDAVKMDKHKKIVIDSKSKLEFLNSVSEYIIVFLDNERMNCIGGLEEHRKNMLEACEHVQNDWIQIQNMYTLLNKEITGKSSKKTYTDLYNLDYLINLQENERKFEKNISKLNMIGTVIYPDYWRVEGMEKIYDTFKTILTETYGKDLTEYEPLDITFDVNEEILEENDEQDEIDEKKNNVDDIIMQRENDVKEEINIENTKKEIFKWQDDDDDEKDDNEHEINLDNFNFNLEASEESNEEDNDIQEFDLEYEDENELKRDEEIDKILGIFDNETEGVDEENVMSNIDEDEDDIESSIFDDIEEEKEKEKGKHLKEEKKKSLFGRRKK